MWKLTITYKKKTKKKVDQFKFETPIPSQVDEITTPQTSIPQSQKIEPFRNIESDSTLYQLFKDWAANNNINNRQSYFSYIATNPTVTLNGRTFNLRKDIEETQFYRDVLQPIVDNVLTKEILFQILNFYFKDKGIILSPDSYARFIKNNTRSVTVPDPITGKKRAKVIVFNGQPYPIPGELRKTPSKNSRYDTQAMSWLYEYQRKYLNVQGNADENTRKLWEADDNTLREIIKEIIQQMVKFEMKIDLENFGKFAQSKLPKLNSKTNDRTRNIPYYEKNGIKYLIYGFNRDLLKKFQREDNTNAWSKIWKEEASPNYLQTWGAEQHLKKAMPSFKQEFPEYTFKTEVPVHEIDSNFIPWINQFRIEQTTKPKFNREGIYQFLQKKFKDQPFRLATIQNADSFKIIPQEDGLYTIQVTRILKKLGSVAEDIRNQTFGNVQPSKFALDFVVYKNNIPIAIYEYDGEFHYGQGQYAKTDLMSDVINDQIQKYYIENETNIPYFRVPYFLIGSSDKFPDYVKNDLKSLI